jgi:hypothetical protein
MVIRMKRFAGIPHYSASGTGYDIGSEGLGISHRFLTQGRVCASDLTTARPSFLWVCGIWRYCGSSSSDCESSVHRFCRRTSKWTRPFRQIPPTSNARKLYDRLGRSHGGVCGASRTGKTTSNRNSLGAPTRQRRFRRIRGLHHHVLRAGSTARHLDYLVERWRPYG